MSQVRLEPLSVTKFVPVPDRIELPPHGFVQYLDHMGSDETVIEAARTSTGRSFISWEPYNKCERCGKLDSDRAGAAYCTNGGPHQMKHFPRGDLGILEYLWKNHHATPFEMPVVRFLIKAPIFYWRQRHRHRAASYNEESARYKQLAGEFYLPELEDVKGQGKMNKQGSEGELLPDVVHDFIADAAADQAHAYVAYEKAIANGIALETARMNLPVSIYSTGIVQTNLRMEFHHLGLRDDAHAQGLTQRYARAEAEFVKALFPRTYNAYEEFTKYAVTLSRTEASLLERVLRSSAFPVDDKRLPPGAEALIQRLTK